MDQSHIPSERRIAARVAVERPVVIVFDDGEWRGHTVNVSTSGLLVAVPDELAIWADVVVALPGVGRREARVVRRDGERYGLTLREPLSAAEFTDFTGIAIEVEEEIAPAAASAPVPRVSPWAFGRDRLKDYHRRVAAAQVPPPRR